MFGRKKKEKTDYPKKQLLTSFDKMEYLKHSQKTKCRYLISGQMSESQLGLLIFIYFTKPKYFPTCLISVSFPFIYISSSTS